MKKLLKALLVVILGTIGMCTIIWISGTTASGAQQASARGEAFGILLAVALIVLAGLAIFKHAQRGQ